MEPASITIMGGVVAIVLGLFEFGKFLINKLIAVMTPQKEDILEDLLQDVLVKTEAMLAMHQVLDADGTPIWYVPRSWAETQKEMMKAQVKIISILDSVAKTQERTSVALERVVTVVDKIEDRCLLSKHHR